MNLAKSVLITALIATFMTTSATSFAATRDSLQLTRATQLTLSATWDGISLPQNELVGTLQATAEVVSYADGAQPTLRLRPGRTSHAPVQIRFPTGFDPRHPLFNRWLATTNGQPERGTLEFVWRDQVNRVVRRVRCTEAWVAAVEIESGGAAVLTVATEQLQFLGP